MQLTPAPADVYRRDFTQGTVLLNGSTSPQTIAPGAGFQRFNGTQAPRFQYIVDDSSAAFSSTGAWYTATYNSGGGTASGETVNGPYYHAWGTTCKELDSGPGNALWNLGITEDGTYMIDVWLPAAPSACRLGRKNAVYDVLANGQSSIFSTTLDQVEHRQRGRPVAPDCALDASHRRERAGSSGEQRRFRPVDRRRRLRVFVRTL